MRSSTLTTTAVVLTGCVSAFIQPPNIQPVPLRREASQGNVTCTLNGVYPVTQRTSSSQAIDTINDIIKEYILDAHTADNEQCPVQYADLVETGATLQRNTQIGFHVELNERGLLSITHFASHSLGGTAHPTHQLHAITVDVSSGERYDLASLFQPGAPYQERLRSLIQQQMERDDIIADAGVQTDVGDWVFYLRPNHLVLGNLFNVYALQATQIAISIQELADIAREGGPIARLLKAPPST